MTDRRSFFKKGIQALLGGAFSFLALPRIAQAEVITTTPMGTKQLHLLLASKKLAERMGILNSLFITHYANNGEIQMEWTGALPPENQIDAATDNLAQQVLTYLGS